jgi:hypothetical protein
MAVPRTEVARKSVAKKVIFILRKWRYRRGLLSDCLVSFCTRKQLGALYFLMRPELKPQ